MSLTLQIKRHTTLISSGASNPIIGMFKYMYFYGVDIMLLMYSGLHLRKDKGRNNNKTYKSD
jgi:hypothetical protein